MRSSHHNFYSSFCWLSSYASCICCLYISFYLSSSSVLHQSSIFINFIRTTYDVPDQSILTSLLTESIGRFIFHRAYLMSCNRPPIVRNQARCLPRRRGIRCIFWSSPWPLHPGPSPSNFPALTLCPFIPLHLVQHGILCPKQMADCLLLPLTKVNLFPLL